MKDAEVQRLADPSFPFAAKELLFLPWSWAEIPWAQKWTEHLLKQRQ
jgi:hypothetical protein